MKAKSLFTVIQFMLVSLIVLFTSCSVASVNADEELVFVEKPIIFGKGGVNPKPLTSGTEWRWFSTQEVVFKISPTEYEENFQDIFTGDNTPIDLSAKLLLQIKQGQTPKLLTKFGEDWYKNNIKSVFVKNVLDEISNYPMKQLTSKREIYANVENIVLNKVQNIINEKDMPIQVLSVIVNRAVPKEDVMDELARTAMQIQAEETQTQRAKTEDAREIAEAKRAKADKTYQRIMNLTNEQYIELRKIEIEKEKIDMIKNKNNVNIHMVMGNGNNTIYPIK